MLTNNKNLITYIITYLVTHQPYCYADIMQSAVDSLIEIPKEEWPPLLFYYQNPNMMIAKSAIKNHIYNSQNISNYPVKFFIPYGELNEGLVIIWNLIDKFIELLVFSLKEEPKLLIKAIKDTNKINLNERFKFSSVLPELQEGIRDLIVDMNIDAKVIRTYIAFAETYLVKKFQYKLHENIELKQLDPKYAEEINEAWPHKYPGSVGYFHNLLKWNMGFGLVDKENQDLYAWIFISLRGDLHSLYVKEEHRRRGYAQILIKYVSKILLERKTDIFSYVLTDNMPAKSLFIGLGFKLLNIVEWRLNTKLKERVETCLNKII